MNIKRIGFLLSVCFSLSVSAGKTSSVSITSTVMCNDLSISIDIKSMGFKLPNIKILKTLNGIVFIEKARDEYIVRDCEIKDNN